jgi:tryptophan synthase alpha chain
MRRIEARFDEIRRDARPGLVAYVTAGDPDLAASRDILRAVERGGADLIEVGVPFSDPVADGPSIQRATERALAAGGNLARTLDLVTDVRAAMAAPIVLFTYVNPVLRMASIGLSIAPRRAASTACCCGSPIESPRPCRRRSTVAGSIRSFSSVRRPRRTGSRKRRPVAAAFSM